MLSLYDEATTHAALALPLDAHLQSLLTVRLDHYAAAGLAGLTHILVVEPGDTQAAIEREVGFYPAIDGRAQSSAFCPSWDWLQDRGGWFEMIVTVGNDGFAFILLIQDAIGVDPALLALCREHA